MFAIRSSLEPASSRLEGTPGDLAAALLPLAAPQLLIGSIFAPKSSHLLTISQLDPRASPSRQL